MLIILDESMFIPDAHAITVHVTIHAPSKVCCEKYGLPSDSFSPESGGRVNPNTAMLAIKTHGTIRLKK